MFFSFETFFSSLIKMTIIITYCANVEHFVHLGTRRRGSWSSEERRDSSQLSIQDGDKFGQVEESGDIDEESPVLTEERRRSRKCSTYGADF